MIWSFEVRKKSLKSFKYLNNVIINKLNTIFRDEDNVRNLEFEPLPELLTEIPLDDVDSSRSRAVITTEPYATSHLEVSTIPNDVMFPEDMFERCYTNIC